MPSSTNLNVFFYVYVLESLKNKKRYIGYTDNLEKRIKEHNSGQNISTKSGLPWRIIYSEACLNQEDAKRREKYFKVSEGRKFLAKRLRCYYKN